jgi:adenine deaminase
LVNEGHMNRVVRHAIAQGLKPITAIQMATLNTAEHFGMAREIGSITPGRRADLFLTTDLVNLPIDLVIARGQVLAQHGKLTADIKPYAYPESARNTVKMKRDVASVDFDIKSSAGANEVTARVIGVIENQAPTKALERTLKVIDGLVEMDQATDVCQIAVVERHRATGSVVNAFVSGFGYNVPCAVASTVAHDSHHMIVIGTNKQDMALAANTLRACKGGIVVVREGKVIALVELVIAGLMSEERAEIVAAKAQRMVEAMVECGCKLNNAYMQHSLLGLVVIPELRISDEGLIDVTQFKKVDLFL